MPVMINLSFSTIAIILLVGVTFSLPTYQHHDDNEMPQTITIGHEESFDHQIEIPIESHMHMPKHAMSYQSFHLDSKNPVPVVYKKEHMSPHLQVHDFGEEIEFGHHLEHFNVHQH